MAKSGPKGPSKPMTDELFTKLVALIRIQCTRDEILAIIDMSDQTLTARLKERDIKDFSALKEQYGSEGKASLRRLQWKTAESGNPQMQIWLGKQMLDQKDKADLTSGDKPLAPFTGFTLTDLTENDE